MAATSDDRDVDMSPEAADASGLVNRVLSRQRPTYTGPAHRVQAVPITNLQVQVNESIDEIMAMFPEAWADDIEGCRDIAAAVGFVKHCVTSNMTGGKPTFQIA